MKRNFIIATCAMFVMLFAACSPLSPADQGNGTTTAKNPLPTSANADAQSTTTQSTLMDSADSTTLDAQTTTTIAHGDDSINVEDILGAPADQNGTTTKVTTPSNNATTSTNRQTSTTNRQSTTSSSTSANSSRTTDKWDNVTVETDSGWSPIV